MFNENNKLAVDNEWLVKCSMASLTLHFDTRTVFKTEF